MSKSSNDVSEWIPLVEPVDERAFALSRELLGLVGPLWGSDLWRVKKFVAHLISHFDDPLEHLLDNEDLEPDKSPVSYFDVEMDHCEILASRYKQEFADLGPEWYYHLFRARLLTLRVPSELVAEYKMAYLGKFEYQRVVDGLIELAERYHLPIPRPVLQQIRKAKELPPTEGWLELERLLDPLVRRGTLTEDDIDGVLSDSLP